MSLLITQTPAVIDPGSLQTSKWISAFNESFFYFQRWDFTVLSVVNASPNIVVNVSSLTPGMAVANGNRVYMKAGNYDGYYSVIASSANSMTLATPYKGNATGFIFFEGRLSNYYLDIYFVKGTGSSRVTVDSSKHRPSPKGLVKYDVGASVSRLVFKNKFDYSTINDDDPDLSGPFTLSVFQSATGVTGLESFEVGEYYYAGTARQLQSLHGSNLNEYVPKIALVNVFNLNFALNQTGWTSGLGPSATFYFQQNSAKYSSTNPGSHGTLTNQNTFLTAGVTYEVIYELFNVSGGSFQMKLGGVGGTVRTTNGQFKDTITAGVGGAIELSFLSTTGSNDVSIRGITIVEAAGVPDLAKFLVQEDLIPTYFVGFPFDLSFIFSDNIKDWGIFRKRDLFEQSQQIGATDTAALNQSPLYVNRLRVADTIPGNADAMDVWLETNTKIVTTAYVGAGYVEPGYTQGG